jgi:hypothetical protein
LCRPSKRVSRWRKSSRNGGSAPSGKVPRRGTVTPEPPSSFEDWLGRVFRCYIPLVTADYERVAKPVAVMPGKHERPPAAIHLTGIRVRTGGPHSQTGLGMRSRGSCPTVSSTRMLSMVVRRQVFPASRLSPSPPRRLAAAISRTTSPTRRRDQRNIGHDYRPDDPPVPSANLKRNCAAAESVNSLYKK